MHRFARVWRIGSKFARRIARLATKAIMSKRLSVWSLLAFSSPGIPATLLIAPVFGILPSYYALHTKVTLAEVGAAFLLARVIDALIDPLVGTLSDRTNSRLGARLPWMIAGAILAIPSAYFFFMPPANASALYFFFASFLTMVAWSLLAIPHGAWAAELSDDYDERSRIFSYKQVLATIGGYSLFFIPPALAPFTHTTEINQTVLTVLVVIFVVLMPTTLVWAARSVTLKGAEIEQVAQPPASVMAVLRSVAGNPPFIWFVAITTLVGIAQGINTALGFLYVQDYLHLGSYFFLAMGIVPGVVATATTPFWLWISRRFDKQRTWAAGLLLSIVVGTPIVFLTPGMHSLIPLTIIIALYSAFQGVLIALPSSVLADVADYEVWKQNNRATGNYFALLALLSKVTTAVGSALALSMSGFLGYAPHGDSASNFFALMVPFGGVHAALMVLAVVLIYYFPLTRRRHALIVKRLAQREERLRAAAVA